MKPPKITEVTVDGEPINIWYPESPGQGYSISMGSGGWLPGSYDSVEAAVMGVNACFKDEHEFVTTLQQPVNHFDKGNRLLTVTDFA